MAGPDRRRGPHDRDGRVDRRADVCSPEVYREWALPYERVVVDTLAAEGSRMALHICGDATRIVNDMVATHSPLLEVDYKVDLAQVKEDPAGEDRGHGHGRPRARS